MEQSQTIQKNPLLNDSSNYDLLRKKGLEYIEQLGSAYWTDYNIHDPGITILELLCYAITDLGYRTSLDIKDLLATGDSGGSPQKQAFFTAAEILTVNPWTNADLRKLLIDIEGVKNAWLQCKTGLCGNIMLYAKCADSTLQYIHETGTPHPVVIKGFYDVLLEFDTEDGAGDLNSGKVKYSFSFEVDGRMETAMIEMRLPTWQQIQENLLKYKTFNSKGNAIKLVNVTLIADGKDGDTYVIDDGLANKIRRPLYATIKVDYALQTDPSSVDTVIFTSVPFSVWFKTDAGRRLVEIDWVAKAIMDNSTGGIFGKYLSLLQRATEVMNEAKAALHSHRNLCEDYCSIYPVQVQEFAVCADMEVEPLADIEAVLAEVYYRIDQYMSADIKFYSLLQLMEEGVPVDEIFDGPRLTCGFIKNEELDSTNLKQYIYTSDIINLLMDIPGIVNIKNFMLAKYDASGNIVQNHEWVMQVATGQQPRFYPEASKILVFKNGLPFLPDRVELSDTLQVIKGKYAQPKYAPKDNDLAVPRGKYYDLDDYYPLQYSLPLTYGVGYAGLPDTASEERKAKAKQLKAYLMFFEQLLVNYLEQLANVKKLFAVDAGIKQSNFSRLLDNDDIRGINEIYNGLTSNVLDELNENENTALRRRNRFLDHLMARFGEQFNDYALMLYSFTTNRALADETLLKNKVAFITDYPRMSSDRAKAFNYKDPTTVCSNKNMAGLAARIKRLLGIKSLNEYIEITEEKDSAGNFTGWRWLLQDERKTVCFVSDKIFTGILFSDVAEDIDKEIESLRKNISAAAKYTSVETSRWQVKLADENGNTLAVSAMQFDTEDAANKFRDRLVVFSTNVLYAERLFVVEHILLRPRNKSVASFQMYEEKDEDGKLYERRWRLIDGNHRIYLSASTRYFDLTLEEAEAKARQEIAVVCKYITNPDRFDIRQEKKWVLNLWDETGEVIATRKQHFATKADAEQARDAIIAFASQFIFYDTDFMPDRLPGDLFSVGDPLLGICIPPDCSFCESEADPYSFRLTVVLSGESGITENGLEFRRFAEQTIRKEVPAHLGVKVCWVSNLQLIEFETVYCEWLKELAKEKPGTMELHFKLKALLEVFGKLKNVYPEASLHDCVDGNDENRVFLGHTAIISDEELNRRIENNNNT